MLVWAEKPSPCCHTPSVLYKSREQVHGSKEASNRPPSFLPSSSQMLLNICSEPRGLEGLLAGNELQALLIATTCLREHSCCFWKEPTFCVLRAISQAQDLSVIQHLQGKSPGSHFPQQVPVMPLWRQDRFLGPKMRRARRFSWMPSEASSPPCIAWFLHEGAFVVHLDAPLEEGKGSPFAAHILSTRNCAGPSVCHLVCPWRQMLMIMPFCNGKQISMLRNLPRLLGFQEENRI